eukprot:TRINITY_DN1591_c0_g1_i4.p1 TRINITY_DN1591_c0_g1~~TRINITY_DN1591_c0_g1_i4.p1  ORF type:complete len:1015 (-),score=282.61 TRINITY_DN1591_c0_g1_i4:1657-4701(-)
MADLSVNVEAKLSTAPPAADATAEGSGGGRSALRDLFPNSPSAAAAAAASNMLASCAELQLILDKMDSADNAKVKQALDQLVGQAGSKLVRVFIAKEVVSSFAKHTSQENEEIELALFSDVVLVYFSVNSGTQYKLIEAFDVNSMYIRVAEGRNEPFISLVRVSPGSAESKAVENERKVVFQNAVRANEWISIFRNALVGAKSVDKIDESDFEYGWKHRLVRGTIFSACLLGETSLVKQLIQKSPDRVLATDFDGSYPVHFAAHGGSVKVMETLFEAKADLNISDRQGRSPMHIALAQRNDKVVFFLCEKGGEDCLTKRDVHGKTPLFSLLSYSADASKEGRKCLEALLEFGVDPNDRITANAGLIDGARQSGGRNSQKGRSGSVGKGGHSRMPSISKKVVSKILLEPGYGALHICARYNLKNLAMMLLLSDASPSLASNPTGLSPLAIALDVDNLEMAKILLDLGAHPNVRDRVGRAPIHFAKTIEGAKLLVSYGARPELVPEKFNKNADVRALKFVRKRYLEKTAGVGVEGDKVASDTEAKLLVSYGARPELVPEKFNKNADVRALKFVRKRYLEKTAGVGVEGDKVASDTEWVDDTTSDICLTCSAKFSFLKRKHHCRRCGILTCNECSNHQFLTYEASAPPSGLSMASTPAGPSGMPSLPREKSADVLEIHTPSDESPLIPPQSRKSIMINPGRRNSKPDAIAEAGFVAQRCCDGCYNYLTSASLYDFEEVLDGRLKPVEQKDDVDLDGDEVKGPNEPQAPRTGSAPPANESTAPALQILLEKELASSKDLGVSVESLKRSKSALEEEVEKLKLLLLESQQNAMSSKEVESLKAQILSLTQTQADLEKANQTKDVIIRGLLEECSSLEQQMVDAKARAASVASMPSPRGAQANYIRELEIQVLELKKVLSSTQKEQEDMWKATEGMERSVAAKKGSKGSSNFGSLKKKNITELESRIANLEFQLVYGQTKKDQTIAKLQDRTKALEQELKDAHQKNVESWLFEGEDGAVL